MFKKIFKTKETIKLNTKKQMNLTVYITSNTKRKEKNYFKLLGRSF